MVPISQASSHHRVRVVVVEGILGRVHGEWLILVRLARPPVYEARPTVFAAWQQVAQDELLSLKKALYLLPLTLT